MNKMMFTMVVVSTIMFVSLVSAQTINDQMSATTPSSQFTPYNDGTITDNTTGLMWKVCSEGQTWASDSGCSGSPVNYSWQQALTQGQAVGVAGYAGYNDWHVPNIKELTSIVGLACYNPAINLQLFPATPSSYFWSASPYAANTVNAWGVTFNYGNDYASLKSSYGYVRLVRGGQ